MYAPNIKAPVKEILIELKGERDSTTIMRFQYHNG
jgi:hypothetical protein